MRISWSAVVINDTAALILFAFPVAPMAESTIPAGRYRHFKGGEYHVIGTARHSETEEILVVYRPLYNNTGWWVRPLAVFTQNVRHEGVEVPRFHFVGEMEDDRSRLEQENILLRSALKTSPAFERLRDLPGLAQVCRAVEQVASTDSTVLVTGETGTGKELVAEAIHELSPRRAALLVKVNCAALPRDLVPSELFGHEAGAFTGAAKRRAGRFELARNGTILLDEIAEISPQTQVLLLRVLQSRAFERVGGNESLPVDARLIAATNKPLADEIREGRFRSDLFYRLNVFPIVVPSLRERVDDIPRLLEFFLGQFNDRMGKRIRRVGSATLERLMEYDWPGNVRELENIVERAVIVTPGETLHVDPIWLERPPREIAHQPEAVSNWTEQERRTILDALARSGGKVYGTGGAAELLGLKPTTLYSKMRKLNIRRHDEA